MTKATNRKLTIAAVLLSTLGVANAADLPSSRPYTAPVVAPVYNWTGIYVGINGGYTWGRSTPMSMFSDSFSSFSYDANGGLIGLTAGAQIQSGHVVIGIEGDINWTNISGSATGPILFNGTSIGTATLSSEVNSISTIRTRVGYAADNWLFYGTGGLALTNEKSNLTGTVGFVCGTGAANSPPCSSLTDLHVGLAAGAGVEYGFTPNVSGKLEYTWVGAGAGNTLSENMFRAGLNYRFGM